MLAFAVALASLFSIPERESAVVVAHSGCPRSLALEDRSISRARPSRGDSASSFPPRGFGIAGCVQKQQTADENGRKLLS